MKKITAVILLFLLFFIPIHIYSQNKSYLIGIDRQYIDGENPAFAEILPGDTLLFESGIRQLIIIKNFTGSPEQPIVITNYKGVITIDTDHYFGISIQNCNYIKITGTGDPLYQYGINIERVANGTGMGIGYLSSDFEIDHVSIKNCMTAGIYAKTDPDCTFSAVRDSFVQRNTIIHDNYIENAGLEGMYIGSSKYPGQTVHCNGKDTLLMPHVLEGVKIFNNTVISPGWDGIQVSSATKDCQIFNNTILYDSQVEQGAQMSGILIGGGTKCDCFNNFIADGKGNGIEIHGLGGIRVFNNIILNAGQTFKPDDITQFKHGIFVTDVSALPDSSFYILHNNIISPKSDGIRFSSQVSRNNQISANVIINPGNFDFYENGNTSFKGINSYVMFQYVETDVYMENNFLERGFENAGFYSDELLTPEDFIPAQNSPLVNAAETNDYVLFDFFGNERPAGIKPDIGAIEYGGPFNSVFNFRNKNIAYYLSENPVAEIFTLNSTNKINKDFYLNFYDIAGGFISEKTHPILDETNHSIHQNISHLKPGIYIYTIQDGEHKYSGKFIKK